MNKRGSAKTINIIIIGIFLVVSLGLFIFAKSIKDVNLEFVSQKEVDDKVIVQCIDPSEKDKKYEVTVNKETDFKKGDKVVVYSLDYAIKKGDIYTIKAVHISPGK